MRVKGSGESTGGGACPSVDHSLTPSPPISAQHRHMHRGNAGSLRVRRAGICTCASICQQQDGVHMYRVDLPVRDVAPFGARPGVPYPSRLAGMIDEDDCRAAVSLASGMSTSAGVLRADDGERPTPRADRRRAECAQDPRATSGLGSAGRAHLS